MVNMPMVGSYMKKHVYSSLALKDKRGKKSKYTNSTHNTHKQRYCTVHHTDKFLVFPGDLVRDAFAPVGEIRRIDKSL